MRAFLFLLLFPLAVSSSSVEGIYKKLLRANPTAALLKISVRSDVYEKCSLACKKGHTIIITTELLNVVQNEDELAGIIGHEMAHAIYVNEESADVLGLQYAQRAGYNYCKAAQFLKRLIRDKSHPAGIDRYKNSGCR